MYANASLMLPFSQGFFQEPGAPPSANQCFHLRLPPQDKGLLGWFQDDISGGAPQMANLVCTSTISEYDLGGEGDLFKAPAPIIEEPELALDPMTAAISMISTGDDITAETMNVVAMESIQEDPLMNDVFYECEKDLLEKSATGEPIFEHSDVKLSPIQTEEVPTEEKIRLVAEGPIQRSISDGCINSVNWLNGSAMTPTFLDFQGLDFEAAFGMRRSFSEGDIQTLGNNNIVNLGNKSSIHYHFKQLLTINDIKAEERREKLSRYRKKKTKRNFGRKIKYACRKALADSQPRVRGRFAKTEECEASKLH